MHPGKKNVKVCCICGGTRQKRTRSSGRSGSDLGRTGVGCGDARNIKKTLMPVGAAIDEHDQAEERGEEVMSEVRQRSPKTMRLLLMTKK